ncbi:hypothetical protein ACH5RR_003684 [Cinchona calisaya]|uniref:F-box domain-containing protein n=1 Tax=Cinchona calisaya TaxID=153742 RepID=A0ABD3AVH1_9GENT
MESGGESGKRVVPKSDSQLGFIQGFGYIPHWVLVELLIRLPIKRIFRFKCVSKQWLSLISDPSFGRAFVSRIEFGPIQRRPWTPLYKCIYAEEIPREHDFLGNLFSSNVGLGCLTKFDLPAPAQAHGLEVYKVLDYIIAKDDNGLLLCGSHGRDLGNYYILNPVTKQYVEIPRSKHSFVYCLVGFITQMKDCIVTSYKIVRLEASTGKTSVLKLEIFSSETGEWRDVDIHFEKVLQLVPFRKMPVVFKESLHFVDSEVGILAYDPYKDPNSCRVIKLPEGIDRKCNTSQSGKTRLFDVHQGYLRYFEVSHALYDNQFTSLSMWTLSDYEAGLWFLEHRISHNEFFCDISFLSSSNLFLVPVAFHPFDFDTVYLGRGKTILSYNMQTRELIVLGNPVPLENISWYLVYLFVLPLWPVSIQAAPSEV